jgi:flagellar motility protein MotE (MotC chaperone)
MRNCIHRVRPAIAGVAMAAALAVTIGSAGAVEPAPAKEPAGTADPADAAEPAEPAAAPTAATVAAQYCNNIADAAADARFARQAAALAVLERDIEDRLARLETKRAEYQDWLDRREKFLKTAEEGLIAIYTQMKPDAASAQLSIMDEMTAAAILSKLPPRTASAILNEMDPTKAAQLTNIMAGLADRTTSQRTAG